MSSVMWIGSPQEHNEDRVRYGCCQLESGEIVSVGAYVYMLPANPLHQLYIAKINDLFEIKEKKYVQVLWLYRQTELKHSPPCVPVENEVYHTSYYDCQLVQSIMGACYVAQYTDCLSEFPNRKEQEISTNSYVCRYSYCEETGEFVEALLADFDHNFCLFSKDHEEQAEHADADTKELIDILMHMEQNMPLQTANALWPARRMAWLKKVKAVTCLEEVKEASNDLGSEFNISRIEPSWKEQVHFCRSSDTLLGYIKSLIQKMQVYAKNVDHGQMESSSLGKLTPRDSFRKDHKRKWAASNLVNPPISKKQVLEEYFICRGICKIEQESLPPDAPPHLKHLRVVLVREVKKDYVTIAYPSMATIAECFGESNTGMEDGSQERKLTSCLLNPTFTSTCTKPRLDEEFRMTVETAQKALNYLIPSSEYLKQGHLLSFWLRSGEYINSRMRETQANKLNSCLSSKEKVSLFFNSEEPGNDNPFQPPDVDTLQKAEEGKTQNVLVKNNDGEIFESNDKLSKDEAHNHQYRRQLTLNNSSQKTMPLSICGCGTTVFPEQIHDTRANCAGAEECVGKLHLTEITEEDQGIVRWGIRKKITYQNRCRGNAHTSDEYRSKVLSFKDRVKGQPDELTSSANRHVALTCMTSSNGKGKMLKVPKEMQGRWSSERYKAAQLKLFSIMKDKGAIPGKPLIRPALRVEARKHIGDTGLLDHLLKHMTDTVIDNGERFRRRHNAEGAMEYWLEDARLQELRKQAGVDQYWIPPLGWKFGDAIAASKGEGLSESHLKELRLLREDVEKLKSQLQYVCLHIGTSFVDSNGTQALGRDAGFQPWKKIEGSTEQAQDRAVRPIEYPVELTSIEASQQNNSVVTQEDAQNGFITREVFQTNAMEKAKDRQELCDKARGSTKETMDKYDENNKDKLSLFYKAARPCLKMSPLNPSKTASAEKKGPGLNELRRSPRSKEKDVDGNKENTTPENHQIELRKACKSPKRPYRQVLSATSANVQLCSAASSRQSKVKLKMGPISSNQARATGA